MLYFHLDIKTLEATSAGEKRSVRKAFKKRIADYQYEINTDIEVIRKFMQNRYNKEYSDILAKMSRYCHSVKLNEESLNIKPIEVSEDVLESDIVQFFVEKGLNFDDVEILPMNDDDHKEYSKFFRND